MLGKLLEKILGKELTFYVKAHRTLVIISIILAGAAAILYVVPILLVQPFVDEAMKPGVETSSFSLSIGNQTEWVLVDSISPNRLLILLGSIGFISVLLRSITLYLGNLAAAAFSQRTIKSLRIDLYKKLISLSLGFYHKRKAGELVSRATADLTVMQATIANVIVGLVQHPLTACAALMYLIIEDWRLTLLAFLFAPVFVGLIRLFGRKAKKHATRVQDATSHVTSAYQESLLCLKVIQGFCMDKGASLKFRDLADHLYKKVMHYNRWFLAQGPMMEPTGFFVILAVFVIGRILFQPTLGELLGIFFVSSNSI